MSFPIGRRAVPIALVALVAGWIGGCKSGPYIDDDLSRSALLAAPPARLAAPTRLRLVTWNIWDLPVISTWRARRMRGIGREIARLDPDVVGIQEAWVERDRELLLETAQRHGWTPAGVVYFPSHIMGSGLWILSKHPIEETFYRRFTADNAWYNITHGDWWAGKGIALARLRLPEGGVVDLFNTHLIGRYRRDGDPYQDVRDVQMHDLAEFVEETACGTAPAFVLGDLNTTAQARNFVTLTGLLAFTRVTAIDEGIDYGYGIAKEPIDHILAIDDPHHEVVVEDVEVISSVATEHGELRLSDHVGLSATVIVRPREPGAGGD